MEKQLSENSSSLVTFCKRRLLSIFTLIHENKTEFMAICCIEKEWIIYLLVYTKVKQITGGSTTNSAELRKIL